MDQTHLTRCDSCMGKKRIKGLGNIEKDCDACRGIGWIEVPDYALETALSNELTKPIVTIKKKRGRKPKDDTTILQCE